MRKKPENPAQIGKDPKKQAFRRQFYAFFLALILCLSSCPAWAEDTAAQGPLPDDAAFPGMDAEGFGESPGFSGGEGVFLLTEASFPADDVPKEYLKSASKQGRVEKVRYTTSDANNDTKSAMVYLPAGYDTSDRQYNVMYILHASSGTPKNYLNPEKATNFQCLLDHMIANGELEPLIVVAATYYPSEGFTQFLPLSKQVEVTASFPRELVEDVLPAVERRYRTYVGSGSEEELIASRDHRAIAGFSLGGVTTWYVFLQQMRMFKWFLPISEASWDDGEGGTTGIWDSDTSAQALYDAVVEQGYAKNDFRLYVATGTEDEAFDVSTNQMVSLLEYADMFKPGENTSCSMMIGGTHTIQAVYTYMYHILPELFAQ